MSEELRSTARAIFGEAMRAADVAAAVRSNLLLREDALLAAGQVFPRDGFDRVLLVALGKAAVPMVQAATRTLHGIPMKAVVVAPPETLLDTSDQGRAEDVVYLPGDHPLITQRSLDAARAILDALAQVEHRTGVLFLISGGASAMLEQPLEPALSLADLQASNRALVGSGLPITQMNTLRKHMSAVKGGRLAERSAQAAWQVTLLVSDVPHASPDAIASGPSLPDSTTVADCRNALRLLAPGALPHSFQSWFSSASLPETPKTNDPTFDRSHWSVILSSEHLAQAALQAAAGHGFHAIVDNTCDDWDYQVAGAYLLRRSRLLAAETQRTVCVISVGEVSVTLSADAGEGGRNQQFALWCAMEATRQEMNVTILSAGSDGVDGHSHAAGAVCDETTCSRAAALRLSCVEALRRFDTTPLLCSIGDAVVTGPTGNNLRDLRLILLEPSDTC